jgi:hypothetical protein
MINFMDFYYTGPGTLAGQYMRKFWHPVFRAEDLKPGWSKPIRVMSEDIEYANQQGYISSRPTLNDLFARSEDKSVLARDEASQRVGPSVAVSR